MQHSARREDHGAKPVYESTAAVRCDAAILNRQTERPKRTDEELARARVRAKIRRRVQELETEQESTSASPAERQCSAAMARGNTAKHEVVKVATQILGRCLTNQNTDKDHTLELQLVHRMLTKECELLAIQNRMENSQKN